MTGYWYGDTANSHNTHTIAFGYDKVDRLSTARTGFSLNTVLNYNVSFNYDAFSNMKCNIISGTLYCPNFSYGSNSNRITNTGYSYDASGNLKADGTYTYTYDAEGRLATMAGMGFNFSAVYYTDGLEAEGASSGSWTQDYVYDAYDPGAQYVLEPFGNPSGGYNAFEVVSLNGRHIAFYNENNTRGTYFVHPNALGSDSNWTDWAGNTANEQIYAPFGQELVTGGENARFASMSHRDQTGFDVTPNRDYSSTIGRWVTPDPLGGKLVDPQTLNKYAYVRNNPTTLTDPTGLDFNLLGGNSCGQTYECDKQGYVLDENNQRFVVTSASLQDPDSGNTAVVNANGVQITTTEGTFEGTFINGTPSATIQGDPGAAGWSDFAFHIIGSDVGHGNLDYGTATYKWSRDQSDVMSALTGMTGEFTYPGEGSFYNNHPGYFNFRFSSGADPSLINYGPSPHFTVSQDPTATVPAGPGYVTPFHIDSVTNALRHLACAKEGLWCD